MEVFKHGKITLIHGDCMEYLAGLDDKAFAVIYSGVSIAEYY